MYHVEGEVLGKLLQRLVVSLRDDDHVVVTDGTVLLGRPSQLQRDRAFRYLDDLRPVHVVGS